MRCKQLADDYNLLFIAALHPPKEAVARRMNMHTPLTLNDGEDTRHWGNKADIGWCVWRPSMKPDAHTYLHVEKLKDHETMGKPTLCELLLDTDMNAFSITRMGYDTILKAEWHDRTPLLTFARGDDSQTVAISPWLMIPAVPVIIAVMAFNFLGDGLRDAADPYGR